MEEFESLYIREKEFYLLLYAKGIETWYGIISNNENVSQKVYSTQELYQMLTGLYQKKYIEWVENKVHVLEPLKTILGILNHTKKCLVIRKDREVSPCYFSEGKVIVIEKSQREEKTLRLTCYTQYDFLQHLWEKEIFPPEELFAYAEEEQMVVQDASKMQIHASLELLDAKTGEKKQRIIIKKFQLLTFIEYGNGRKTNFCLYQKEWCMNQLKDWMRRAE
jgi:hypothetical protein